MNYSDCSLAVYSLCIRYGHVRINISKFGILRNHSITEFEIWSVTDVYRNHLVVPDRNIYGSWYVITNHIGYLRLICTHIQWCTLYKEGTAFPYTDMIAINVCHDEYIVMEVVMCRVHRYLQIFQAILKKSYHAYWMQHDLLKLQIWKIHAWW